MSDPNDYLDEDSYFDGEPHEEEIEYVSKTELKRISEQLQKMGEEIVGLSDAHLATIPMDEELAEAIAIARKISRKKDGFRRQLQFIGKLMRFRDTQAIEAALAKLKNQHQAHNAAFHAMEKARDAIIAQGDAAIQPLLEEFGTMERQKLRQFHRQIKKEREKNAPPKAFRELFQYLKEHMGAE